MYCCCCLLKQTTICQLYNSYDRQLIEYNLQAWGPIYKKWHQCTYSKQFSYRDARMICGFKCRVRNKIDKTWHLFMGTVVELYLYTTLLKIQMTIEKQCKGHFWMKFHKTSWVSLFEIWNDQNTKLNFLVPGISNEISYKKMLVSI